jgi:RNA polymerase sigma factor (sigma-70 family)
LASFEEQLEGVYADAVRFARGLAGSPADGGDLLQDALVRAWRGYPRLRDPARFRFWLLRIIGNAHRSWARRRALRRWLALEAARDVPAESGIDFAEKDAVRQALLKLPRDQRETLVLFEVLGLSVVEIAEIQAHSPSAVKSRLSRGRARLREHYQRLDQRLGREEVHGGTEMARTHRAGASRSR